MDSADGVHVKDLFELDQNCIFLNSAEYGITPTSLVDAKFKYFALIENNSDLFFRHKLFEMTDETRMIAASIINAPEENVVFLDDYVEAIHTVMRSCCHLEKRDILLFDFLNPEALKVCKFIAKYNGLNVIEIKTSPLILNSPQLLIDELKGKLDASKIGIVYVEHVSNISLILPIKDIVAACREKNITCVVDGNHSFCHIDLNIKDIDPGRVRDLNNLRFLHNKLQLMGIPSKVSCHFSHPNCKNNIYF